MLARAKVQRKAVSRAKHWNGNHFRQTFVHVIPSFVLANHFYDGELDDEFGKFLSDAQSRPAAERKKPEMREQWSGC